MLRQLSPSCPSLIINRLDLPVYELPTTHDFHYKKEKERQQFIYFIFFLCPGQHTPSHFVRLASICCHFSFSLLLSLQTHSSFLSSSFPPSSRIPLCPSLCCFSLVSVYECAVWVSMVLLCITRSAGQCEFWSMSMNCCFRLEGSASACVVENQASSYNDNSCR